MTVNWDTQATINAVRAAAVQGVFEGTQLVHSTAVQKILSGTKSGVIYRRRGVEHQASAPGEAPASDTSRLAQSGRTTLDQAEIVGQVIFSTEYAAALEFGREDGSIAARPFLRPSLAEKNEEIQAAIAARITEALK